MMWSSAYYFKVTAQQILAEYAPLKISVSFSFPANSLQFTSNKAETSFIVKPWCGAAHIVSGLLSTKSLQSYAPLKISINFLFPAKSS